SCATGARRPPPVNPSPRPAALVLLVRALDQLPTGGPWR
uniref:Uncharacterized protein n=1 Tax=Aegilops tauschii subsp. strangulata TaxID=200361 RepID=A0A453LSJ9_AEGTS